MYWNNLIFPTVSMEPHFSSPLILDTYSAFEFVDLKDAFQSGSLLLFPKRPLAAKQSNYLENRAKTLFA